MLTPENATALQQLLTRYLEAQQKSSIAAERRSDLQPGSTRAKVTTANARWMAAAEERDRALKAADTALLDIFRPQVVASVTRAHGLLVDGLDKLRFGARTDLWSARQELADQLKRLVPGRDPERK
jgi:hypothetical protein